MFRKNSIRNLAVAFSLTETSFFTGFSFLFRITFPSSSYWICLSKYVKGIVFSSLFWSSCRTSEKLLVMSSCLVYIPRECGLPPCHHNYCRADGFKLQVTLTTMSFYIPQPCQPCCYR